MSSLATHPYRHAESAPEPRKRSRGASALAAGVMVALVAAIVLALSSFETLPVEVHPLELVPVLLKLTS